MMEEWVARRLRDLNRQFYNDFAAAFSDSRGRTEPGLDRALAPIEAGDRLLDLGCGQARLAQLLPQDCDYVGVDYAAPMLEVAAEAIRTEDGDGAPAGDLRPKLRLICADLVADPWPAMVDAPFDWVVMRAVLHHIPGYDNRQLVVRRAAEVLSDTGTVVVANWQFLQIERLRRRVLPWSVIGLTEEDVDAGDYLLDWRRRGRGLRYTHHIDEEETQRLARCAGLEVQQMFRADGHTNDLTLYAILRKKGHSF